MIRPPPARVTLTDIISPERNSFGLLRLALAAAVLVSHSYFFVAGQSSAEPLYALTGHSLGEHAVQVFFFLSGLLVTLSFAKSGSLIDFLVARGLRIFPGLVVCVGLTALALGPLISDLALHDYLSTAALPRYIVGTLLLITGSAPLPGVFEPLPAMGLVNMSLWTLKYEVLCYLGLGLICATGALRDRAANWATAALALFLVVLSAAPPKPVEAFAFADNVRYFAQYFGMGVLACQLREWLVIRSAALPVLFALFVFALGTRWQEFSCALFLGYATLCVAALNFGPLSRVTRTTDVSFGLYIYAAPIQQTLLLAFPSLSPLALSVAALVLTMPLAWMSWELIERPALACRAPAVAALKSLLVPLRRARVAL